MSNEALEKYKKLYEQLVSNFVGVHNTHLSFIKYVGRDTGFATRRQLANIISIAKEMQRQGRKVCKQEMANKRLQKIQLREEKKNKKLKNGRSKIV